jgi:hypothetical protein
VSGFCKNCVAGDEQHLDALALARQVLGQQPPAHARQDDVGHQQVDRPGVLPRPR